MQDRHLLPQGYIDEKMQGKFEIPAKDLEKKPAEPTKKEHPGKDA